MNTKIRPLSATVPAKARKIEEFIASAENPYTSGALNVSKNKDDYTLPWEEKLVRDDLKKTFNLRLSERDYIKLEYLAKTRRESMHKVCIDILLPGINKLLNIED